MTPYKEGAVLQQRDGGVRHIRDVVPAPQHMSLRQTELSEINPSPG